MFRASLYDVGFAARNARYIGFLASANRQQTMTRASLERATKDAPWPDATHRAVVLSAFEKAARSTGGQSARFDDFKAALDQAVACVERADKNGNRGIDAFEQSTLRNRTARLLVDAGAHVNRVLAE